MPYVKIDFGSISVYVQDDNSTRDEIIKSCVDAIKTELVPITREIRKEELKFAAEVNDSKEQLNLIERANIDMMVQ